MKALHKTKPFECWQKAKELRLDSYKRIMAARENGKLLVTGNRAAPEVLMAGFGDFEFLGIADYGASVAYAPDFAQDAYEILEARGFSRDLCGYSRAYLGSMMLDRFYFGGPFPRPDLVYTQVACDTNVKNATIIAEHFGIPHFSVDVPVYLGYPPRLKEHFINYLVSQFQDIIEGIGRATGRQFDDERFIQALYSRFQTEVLWAEIMMLNQAVPAPMDLKSMFTLFVPLIIMKEKPEAVTFYQGLKEEMEDRVKNGIAAVASEQCRLLHDGLPPWFSLRIFRLPQSYGAVFIGSHYSIVQFGAFEEGPDGRLRPRQTPQQQGIRFRTREEALRFFAEWYLDKMGTEGYFPGAKLEGQVHLVKEWHIDGVVFHNNRGCEGQSQGLLENKAALGERLGVPTLVYEANAADSREWAEEQVIDSLESFMESLGLTRLEE
ncbi:MAG: 2-hydroxyacyl-CoA dehydratase subunit D [Dehalococcoidia bacterium]